MKMDLNDVDVRVLGSLIEKELTTPEYYPLSLNALTNACNQKSNRDPVMNLEAADVVRSLDKLGSKGLARLTADGGRVSKYRHSMADKLHLKPTEIAVLAELLLRGHQTVGELRVRADRMASLPDLAKVEEILQELVNFGPPLVMKLPRQPGRKEQRYAHLLAGEPEFSADEFAPQSEAAPRQVSAGDDRLAGLEEEVALLTAEIADLRRLIEEFKRQFQ